MPIYDNGTPYSHRSASGVGSESIPIYFQKYNGNSQIMRKMNL